MADVQIFREHLEKHNLVGFGGMLVSYPTKYNHHETNEVIHMKFTLMENLEQSQIRLLSILTIMA